MPPESSEGSLSAASGFSPTISILSMASSSRSRSERSRYSRIGTWTFCLTVRAENSAPCWNSTPHRRSSSRRSAGDSSSRFSPEHLDGAGPLRHQTEDGPGQDRLALPRSADEAQDLAAIHVEIEALHDRALAEADFEVADADDRFASFVAGGGRRVSSIGQYLIAAKNMANSPSSTMTMKIAFTTDDVTCRPSDSAEPFDGEALDGRDDADDERHERRLDQPDQEGVEADRRAQPRQEDVEADVAVEPGRDAAAGKRRDRRR